jgi:tetratricopeptide (TPR) repeat protein
MPRPVTARLILFAVVEGTLVAAGRAERVTPAAVLAVEHWSQAVNEHTPGQPDAAVTFVHALSFGAREALNAGMTLFMSALVGKAPVASSAEDKRVVEIGLTDRRLLGANAFLERAATLHADAVMVSVATPTTPGQPPSGELLGQPASRSPLLSSDKLILANDGEYAGTIETNWNWMFARSLLDLVSPKSGATSFVGQWYHATTAYLLQHGQYGEASAHLERAATLLPDDPLVLFDRGCLSEILGLPQAQQLLTDADLIARRKDRVASFALRLARPDSPSARQIDIPAEEVANENAERLFRRTLQVAPTFVEARVRLARLLEVRGRFVDAASELATALNDRAVSRDRVVSFYAQLFAGRADQALGRMTEAVRHDEEAIAMFPDAQSALLARSELALITAEIDGALAPIRRLAELPADSTQRVDPWWLYQLGPGRDADVLVRQMWANLPH